jgi:hypothetical protein
VALAFVVSGQRLEQLGVDVEILLKAPEVFVGRAAARFLELV